MTLTQRRLEELKEFYQEELMQDEAQMYLGLMSSIPHLPQHGVRVGWNSVVLGAIMGADDEELGWLSKMYAHDVGKPLVDETWIFSSSKRVNDREREIIQQHARRGIDYVKRTFPWQATYLLGSTHERLWDGAYPRQHRRPVEGRLETLSSIPAIADSFDVLLHPARKYMDHRWRSPKEIGAIILENNDIPEWQVACAVGNYKLLH